MANIFSKLGAISYVLWGILHIVVASKVYALGQTLDAGIVQARIFQDAWSLLFFAIFATFFLYVFAFLLRNDSAFPGITNRYSFTWLINVVIYNSIFYIFVS